ncbi:MAG: DUF501 domain-containing protein [Synergistaceae bacterium]|nr:DUF501 domain-containing protein [Synergistaceae bacterium]
MTRKKNFCGGCLRVSPVFAVELRELSARYSDNKQRFDPSLIAGCVRCRFGGIQVLVCRPFTGKRIFPTTFWLVCPYLTKLAGTLESRGGVSELEKSIKDVHEWRRYNMLHQVIRLGLAGKVQRRFMQKYRASVYRSVMRSGIGGMKQTDGVNVKCLHLQAASMIALGRHPGGEWLRTAGLCSDCGERHSCCRSCSPAGQG